MLASAIEVQPKGLPDRLAQLLQRGGIVSLTDGIELTSLWRWVRLSLLVGAIVGLAAAGVFYVIEWAESVLLYGLGVLKEPTFGTGERLFSHDTGEGAPRWWLVLLLPAAGGLLSGLVTWRFAMEARGPGVNEVIDAYHRETTPRARVPLVKLIATTLTLSTGGSAGREGPMAMIGAGMSSLLGRVMHLSAREKRLLLLAGAAGGIAALFRAPLGAALWSLEVLYRDDFEAEGLFPCLVSSVTAYSVFTLIFGQGSLFHVPVAYDFHPAQLIFYAAAAVMFAPFGVLWFKLDRFSEKTLWTRVPVPAWAKPAVGGLLLGALCIGVPWVLSSGYGWIQDALRTTDDPRRQLPVGFEGFGLLLGIAVAKMVATQLTVRSGGSGGKFMPMLFIGGFIGGGFGLLFHELAPSIVTQPGAFVLVGMGTFYAALGRVPIATIILVSELFGSYDLLVPLMFSEMIALLLLRRYTIYETQVDSRLESPAHMAEFTVDVLQDLRVADVYTRGRASATIPANMNVRDFLEHVSTTADSYFVVHDTRSRPVGVVSLSNVRSVVSETQFLDVVLVADAMWPFKSVEPATDLREALRISLESGYDHLPVVDPAQPRVILGMLSQSQIFEAYNAEIVRRRLGAASDGGAGGEAGSGR